MPSRDPTPSPTTERLAPRGTADHRPPPTTQLEAAIDRLLDALREGLEHGFFDYSMSCEIVRSGKRRLTIRAGKSHRFVIPEEELE